MLRARKLHKQALVLLLVLCLNLGMISNVFAQTQPSKTAASQKSDDLTGHWAESVLRDWQSRGLITGYEDGSMKPGKEITRAELATILNKAMGVPEGTAASFKDVKADAWYSKDVAKVSAAGHMKGYTDQTFKPNRAVTRQELAVIIASVLDLAGSESAAQMSDAKQIAAWSKGAVGAVIDAGIMEGSNGKFRPAGNASRAEAVSVLDRAMNQYSLILSQAGEYGPASGTETVTGSVLINASGVTLRNTVIEGDLVLGEGIGEGDVYLNNVEVKGTTTVKGGGKNSIHVTDSVLVSVIVNKKDGSIRLVVEGASVVEEITLQSGARLEENNLTGSGFNRVVLSDLIPTSSAVTLAGTFETVDIFATSFHIDLASGSVGTLRVNESAVNTNVAVAPGVVIGNLIANAAASITGSGTIQSATIQASGVSLTQTPANLTLGSNLSVSIGGQVRGNNGSTTNTSNSNSGGSSGVSNPPSVPSAVYGFEGTITDVNNVPVEGVTIKFRRGIGSTTGEVVGTAVTDANGKYTIILPAGSYTGELVKSGFITTYVVGVSLTSRYNTGQDATAIRIPAGDELRIVLTWGEFPRDEDSHLIGPRPDGTYFHTAYYDKVETYNGEVYADLDHDDVTSYGPETTTIRKLVDGQYQFYVHNFSGNGSLRDSGAKVEVYSGDNATPVRIYHIPVGQGNELYWHVFNMEVTGGNIDFVEKNILTFTEPSAPVVNRTPAPQASQVVRVNNPGPTDTLTVSGLRDNDIAYVRVYDAVYESAPVSAGSGTATFSDLNFDFNASSVFVSVKSQGMLKSDEVHILVPGEVQSALSHYSNVTVPMTTFVHEPISLVQQPITGAVQAQVKSVQAADPTVTSDVYLRYDSAINALVLDQYNGSGSDVSYKVTIEVTIDGQSDTTTIVVTVPTVEEVLSAAVQTASTITDQNVIDKRIIAEAVMSNSNSSKADYVQAVTDLLEAIRLATP